MSDRVNSGFKTDSLPAVSEAEVLLCPPQEFILKIDQKAWKIDSQIDSDSFTFVDMRYLV